MSSTGTRLNRSENKMRSCSIRSNSFSGSRGRKFLDVSSKKIPDEGGLFDCMYGDVVSGLVEDCQLENLSS